MANICFLYEGVENTFCIEDDDDDDTMCHWILGRGKRKMQKCGKKSTFSFILRRSVPACAQHVTLYEKTFSLLQPEVRVRGRYNLRNTPQVDYAAMDEEREQTQEQEQIQEQQEQIPPNTNLVWEEIPVDISISDTCTVCLEKKFPLLLPCRHTVCFDCTTHLFENLCPYCRCPFEKTLLRRFRYDM